MRICIDLDGVVCSLKTAGQTYKDPLPVEGAVEAIRQLREQGHYLILYTARHMKTCAGNTGRVVALQGATTLEWLDRHGLVFDEVHFGKPWADVYIDDNALRFTDWQALLAQPLPRSTESALAANTEAQPDPRQT